MALRGLGAPAGPALKYPGAKWRIADWILDRLPPHKTYVEPFFGSGAIFLGSEYCSNEKTR